MRGEEQNGGGSVGGPIAMNRWWGKEKVKPVSVGVTGTHPVLCGQMCGRAASYLSPSLPPLMPGQCCQSPLACAQKLTHLPAFVLCYSWTRTRQRKIASLRGESRPCLAISLASAHVRRSNVTFGNAVMFGLVGAIRIWILSACGI